MQVAYVQYNPAYLQVTQNLKQVEALLEGVEADLIVLPELFASGYFFRSHEDLEAVAEPIPETYLAVDDRVVPADGCCHGRRSARARRRSILQQRGRGGARRPDRPLSQSASLL
nr:nitrilase-related carbon-nitrogen hydrolase [Rhodothermus marinus]